MHRFLLLLVLVMAGIAPAAAQTYFNERYQSPLLGRQLIFTSVVPTDSGYLASGFYYNYPTPGTNGLVLRFLSATGEVIRSRYYAGFATGNANALHRLPDGGYVAEAQWVRTSPLPLAGYTVLLRFDSQGDTLWTRRYLNGRSDNPLTMCVLPAGGFAIAGYVGAPTVGQLDMLLVRLDARGNRRWWRQYPSAAQNEAWTMSATPDGGFLLCGDNYDLTQVNTYILKADSLGNEQWHYECGSPTYDDGVAVGTALPDGNYLIASTIGKRFNASNNHTYYRQILYWLNPQGQLLRQREFGPEVKNAATLALHLLPDGSVVCAGQQGDRTPQQLPEAFIYKLRPNGDSAWFHTYKKLLGRDSHNYLRDLRPTADGGFVAAGFLFSYPPDTGAHDAWVFKVDSLGRLQAPVGVAPAIDPDGLALYPNPSPEGRFTLEAPAGATLTVSDALGRRVFLAPQAPGKTLLDLSAAPSGLYLLRLTWPDGRHLTRRLVR